MKVFAALYCDCTHESAYGTLSLHMTREGAEQAIKNHKNGLRQDHEETVKNMAEYEPSFDIGEFKIYPWQDWVIEEYEILD